MSPRTQEEDADFGWCPAMWTPRIRVRSCDVAVIAALILHRDTKQVWLVRNPGHWYAMARSVAPDVC